MNTFATILAARWFECTATAPAQYSATKFHASGPLTTPTCSARGAVLCLKYAALKFAKLTTSSTTAST
jgi:hypothetical protein